VEGAEAMDADPLVRRAQKGRVFATKSHDLSSLAFGAFPGIDAILVARQLNPGLPLRLLSTAFRDLTAIATAAKTRTVAPKPRTKCRSNFVRDLRAARHPR
jgi:hypothetical protein